jgi:hypothetical protein
MTTSFADYVSEQDAKNTIQLNVTKWCLMLCDALKDAGHDDYDYIIESGTKYHKIIMIDNCVRKNRSIHAFVDKKTGEVYKPATWKSPAKHVRYDLRLIKDREWLFENADWAGSYLYMK